MQLLAGASLFLDLDGTLLDLVDRPHEVVADEGLRGLLARLKRHLGGRLAIVSGRSLDQLDRILGDVAHELALAGSHGSELRRCGATSAPDRLSVLDQAADQLHPFAAAHRGVLVEEKSFGVALHYRMAPDAEAEARHLAAGLAERLGLAVQPGKMMIELRVPGMDKGDAVRRLMAAAPMAGGRPIFIGDDLTDEPAFRAAHALDGEGILVGAERPTAARYRISASRALRDWLGSALP